MVPPKIQAWETKFDTNLTTLRQSPLNPSMIWIVDAMRRAPCVPLIVRKNFFMWAVKSLSIILVLFLKKLASKETDDWWAVQQKKLVWGTSWGFASLLYRPAKMIEMVGPTKMYEPPITTGRRVPKNVWNRVFMPATNNIVWTTRAFSCWQKG
jgi:hypothetical protein